MKPNSSEVQVMISDLIIEMMPFSQELVAWCKSHPDFLAALKIIYSEKFIMLGAIVTSYSPYSPTDEVIGIYTYDYARKNPLFKQDFIINKGKLNKEFVLFTRNPKGNSSKFVKDINEFYKTYGKGEFYINSHHLTLEQLPQAIRERGQDAINLANRLKNKPTATPPHEVITKISTEVKALKISGGFVEWKRLN